MAKRSPGKVRQSILRVHPGKVKQLKTKLSSMKATTTDQAAKVFSTLLAKFLESKDIKTYSSLDITIRREGDGIGVVQVTSYIGGGSTEITSFTVCKTADLPEDILNNINF